MGKNWENTDVQKPSKNASFAARKKHLRLKMTIGRENLYKTLSGTANPKWHTLVSLVIALELN